MMRKINNEIGFKKRVLGVWYLNASPVTLGGLLILIEELQIQCLVNNLRFSDLCVIGNPGKFGLKFNSNKNNNSVFFINENLGKFSLLFSLAWKLKGVQRCYFSQTFEALQSFIKDSYYALWPSEDFETISNYKYDSTLVAQKFYGEKGFIPNLSCKASTIKKIFNYIKKSVLPKVPIVLHLKNNGIEEHCSNASFNSWIGFLDNYSYREDLVFILIGNEKLDPKVESLPNIVTTKKLGFNLYEELALIQMAFVFMGMASGPCNMAIFNDVPYIIFKNPDHHAEEMRKELGESNKFSFAKPSQIILREFESKELLISSFEKIYSNLDKKQWRQKLEALVEGKTNWHEQPKISG